MASDKEETGILIPDECRHWIHLQRPESKYEEELKADFRQIEPFLQEKVESILDIGCGMAGIDVYLKRKFPDSKLYLLDGDGEKAKYGWNAVSTPYNSRKSTEALLKANGFAVDKWFDIGTKEELKADLIISLLSWGFHYPLNTYKVSGFCIADLRIGHGEVNGKLIHRAQKYNRVAFRC